jgi:Uma2 family endonuclease
MNALAQIGVRRPMRGVNPLYPCSDGKPMAESRLQYRWIVTLQGNLEYLFRDRADVFVAADNPIYPEEGKPEVCQAPDVYVAFGVPKEDRGSFIVFEEGGVFPQVVFEVRSPNNRPADIARKLVFYDKYGAEEYYDFDPKRNRLNAYVRDGDRLDEVEDLTAFVSPRLGIRFDLSGPEMVVYGPDGQRFLTREELAERADADRDRAEAERERADAERDRAEVAEQEVERLRAKLRAAGIDPDAAGP